MTMDGVNRKKLLCVTCFLKQLLKNWEKNFYEDRYDCDQRCIRELLWLSDLRLLILPAEYNWKRVRFFTGTKSYEIAPKILHLANFKRELEIQPSNSLSSFDSLSLRKKIKLRIIYKIMPKFRKRFLGSLY